MNNIIIESKYNKDDIVKNGNKFMIGNIFLGCRGTLEEYTKNELVAVNVPLLYDGVEGKWRESVNAPNPFYTLVKVDNIELNPLQLAPKRHSQALHLDKSLHERETMFSIGDNNVTITATRFISDKDNKLLTMKYKIATQKSCNVELTTGIDGDVWDINGPHLIINEMTDNKDVLRMVSFTQELRKHIIVFEMFTSDFKDYQEEVVIRDSKILRVIKFRATANDEYIFYKYARISYDEITDEKTLIDAKEKGYNKLLEEHCHEFKKRFDIANVKINGDNEADLALRYSIYQLLLLAPARRESSSIPARGISGQTYKGAIFWDTEMFLLPFYLNTDLKSAKEIIKYRINSLDGAISKARQYGYKGAFYAWESQENGFDACTDYNVTDVFTKRLVRTYFRDKQIHINSAIVFGLMSYFKKTNDIDILKNGLEMIYQSALFYYDYGYFSLTRQTFELLDVLGPDEYHERVNNNAYTNKMVLYTFEALFKALDIILVNDEDFLNSFLNAEKEGYINGIKGAMTKLVIKKPNDSGIIEQFDGYFKLKDTTLQSLLAERLNKNEYLGGHGLAGDTKIIKQADVITMLYLFKDEYDKEILEKNFLYYEPKTEHGSSLSSSMYALIASAIGLKDYAYSLFMKSATIDLTGNSKQFAGDIYIGGTHPAASGGAYMTAIYGFAGLSNDGKLKTRPCLPNSITSINFNIIENGRLYNIHVTKQRTTIKGV